jgi:hypothetical protein
MCCTNICPRPDPTNEVDARDDQDRQADAREDERVVKPRACGGRIRARVEVHVRQAMVARSEDLARRGRHVIHDKRVHGRPERGYVGAVRHLHVGGRSEPEPVLLIVVGAQALQGRERRERGDIDMRTRSGRGDDTRHAQGQLAVERQYASHRIGGAENFPGKLRRDDDPIRRVQRRGGITL